MSSKARSGTQSSGILPAEEALGNSLRNATTRPIARDNRVDHHKNPHTNPTPTIRRGQRQMRLVWKVLPMAAYGSSGSETRTIDPANPVVSSMSTSAP